MHPRNLYLSDEDWTRWKAQAKKERLSLSAWLRRAANEREALEKALEERDTDER